MQSKAGLIKKSIGAGILIGIGGTCYLLTSPPINSLLFSIGLISVVIFQCKLFTGIIGGTPFREYKHILIVLAGNTLGAYLTGFVVGFIGKVQGSSVQVLSAKIAQPGPETFIRALICGALMCIAVNLYSKTKNLFGLILPVMCFILSGFEHCVAQIFYIGCFHSINAEILIVLALGIAGNTLGAKAVNWFIGEGKKANENLQPQE